MIEFKVFNDGDDVPEWLLSIVPRSPRASPGKATFRGRCIVVVERDRYFLVPDNEDEPPILIEEAKNTYISTAGERRLVIPIRFQTFYPKGSDRGRDVDV